MSLPAGSYRLVAVQERGSRIYYPFLVRSHERTDVTLRLPESGSTPPGFVYVPAGRFLVGSADDENLRTAQASPPLHEAETGAFLISESEVTFAQWIDYLEAAGPRAQEHLPSIENSKGLVRLRRRLGRWTLQLRPTSKDYFAQWGEPSGTREGPGWRCRTGGAFR